MKLLLSMVLLLCLVSCKDIEESVSEQSYNQAQGQIDAENDNIAMWVDQIRDDVVFRGEYLDSISGRYRGNAELSRSSNSFDLDVKFSNNIPLYLPERNLTIEELQTILSQQNLNAHVMMSSRDLNFATGCVFENVNVNYSTGQIRLVDSECPYTFEFNKTEEGYQVIRDDSFSNSPSVLTIIKQSENEQGPVARTSNYRPAALYSDELEAMQAKVYRDKLERIFSLLNGISQTKDSSRSSDPSISARLDIVNSSDLFDFSLGFINEEMFASYLENLKIDINLVITLPGEYTDKVSCSVSDVTFNFDLGYINAIDTGCNFNIKLYIISKSSRDVVDKRSASQNTVRQYLSGVRQSFYVEVEAYSKINGMTHVFRF